MEILLLVFCVLSSSAIAASNVVENKKGKLGRICEARKFEYDSVVCACNSTYCDFIPETKPPELKKFHVYESNKAGKRFDFSVGDISADRMHDSTELFLNLSQRHQKMLGWGGAFTDSAGINIKKLSKASQEMLLQTYFSKSGSRYNFGRIPIAGTDFSTRPYTYDDLNSDEVDLGLKKFALQEEDYKYKIPLMTRALEMNPELLFLSATWSAPTWMKTNEKINGIGYLKLEYYKTYTDYLIKFFDEYKKHNISFWALSTGNEPNNVYVMDINSMGWTPRTTGKWVTENLGPTLVASIYNKTQIHILDDQRLFLPFYLKDMLSKFPDVKKYASGIAVHWYWDTYISPVKLDETAKLFPDMYMLMTEACTGFMTNDLPKVKLGSWERGQIYLVKILENVNHGVVGWVDWNLALDKEGGPSWIKNEVDAPIIVNPDNDEFYKQPVYYAITHFSRFVPRESIRLNITENKNVKATAFETPGKNIVVLLCNTGNEAESVSIKDTLNNHVNLELSPSSWNTVLYNPQKKIVDKIKKSSY